MNLPPTDLSSTDPNRMMTSPPRERMSQSGNLPITSPEQMGRAEKMRILGEMASGIIHDFNNMLGAILGRAQLVRFKTDLEEIKKQVAQIEKIALQGGETVKRLQEFTRFDQNNGFSPTDLNQVIADALEVTRHRWEAQAQAHGILYVINTTAGKDAWVPGIHSELVDAVANMIFNALDAMPQGGPLTIETARLGSTCRLVVADEGVGMTPEQVSRIFSPFYTTKGSGGTGLGLAVVHGAITRHSGHIDVESAPGKGSRFIIHLPTAGVRGEAPPTRMTAQRTPGRRVLLVDDDPTILDVIGEALRDVGHDVKICDNGAAAIVAMQDAEYDVVVTDLGMPGVTGWEVARRARDKNPRLPVVVISGWGSQIDKRQLSECGVAALLAKPFRLEQIRDTIARVARPAALSPS